MRRIILFIIILFAVAVVLSCGSKEQVQRDEELSEDSILVVSEAFVTGLACDGCSDSAVWLLPMDVSDPIRYDIVAARRKHMIFGKMKIGDAIAVVVNAEDSTVADVVVDIDQLKGTWAYLVYPHLKNADRLPPGAEKHILDGLDDSLKALYYQPREYGIALKRNNVAAPLGSVFEKLTADDDEQPFVYDAEDMYVSWRLLDYRLVLTRQVEQRVVLSTAVADTLDDGTVASDEADPIRIEGKMVCDTVNLALLMEDSLVLIFPDRTQGYYRKK